MRNHQGAGNRALRFPTHERWQRRILSIGNLAFQFRHEIVKPPVVCQMADVNAILRKWNVFLRVAGPRFLLAKEPFALKPRTRNLDMAGERVASLAACLGGHFFHEQAKL